jgi:AcrR family transcriptional regulator
VKPDNTAPVRRTGGRSALVVAAVRSAVEELVKERGAERVTVPMIAERAGVNATSIYRRWTDVPTLVNEVATSRLDPGRPLPQSGDLRSDLRDWAREIVTHYSIPTNAALLRAGAALAGDEETDCLHIRRTEASAIIEHSGATGPGVPTPDQVINHLISPIVYRVIFLPSSANTALVDTLIEELFALAAQPPAVSLG